MKTISMILGMLAGFFFVSQASATIVTVTVTGTADRVYDPFSLGTFSGIQIGDPFTAIYTFDTAQAGTSTVTAHSTSADGGSIDGYGPFGDVQAEVGSQNYSLEGSYVGVISSSSTQMEQYVDARDANEGFYLLAEEGGVFPINFDKAGIYTDFTSGYMEVAYETDNQLTTVDADLQRVTVSTNADSSVPEATSLSLVAAGLMGMSGFMWRSSKRRSF